MMQMRRALLFAAILQAALLLAAPAIAQESTGLKAEIPSLGELNLLLRAVQAERQAAMSDFARGQELIKAAEHGQLLMDHARRRVEEANAREARLLKQIEEAKGKADKDVAPETQGRD